MIIKNSLYNLFSGEGRTLNVKRNIIYSVVIKLLSIIVSFLLVPLTIDYLSPELYGVWLTLSSLLTWLTFLDFGFSQGLKNKLIEAIAINDWKKGKKLVSTTYFLMILIFVPLSIFIQLLIPFIDWCKLLNISVVFREDIIKTLHVLMAFCCIQMIVNVVVSVIASFQRVALSNSFGVIGNIISLFIIWMLTKISSPSLLYLCCSLVTMPIIVTFIATIILFKGPMHKVSPSIKEIDLSLTKELFSLGYKFFIINIQAVVLYQSTNIIISNVSSPIWVTSYNIAYRYLSIAMMLFMIAMQPLWPAFADAYAKKDMIWMKKTEKKMTVFFYICSVGCFIMALLAPSVYNLWIGNQTIVPIAMTYIVLIYVLVYCWVSLNGTLLVGMSKIKLNTLLCIWGMIIHIVLALWLGKIIGAYGVLLSMIIVNIIYGVLYKIQLVKILNGTARGIWNE